MSRSQCGDHILRPKLLLPLRKPGSHHGIGRFTKILLLAVRSGSKKRRTARHTAHARLFPLETNKIQQLRLKNVAQRHGNVFILFLFIIIFFSTSRSVRVIRSKPALCCSVQPTRNTHTSPTLNVLLDYVRFLLCVRSSQPISLSFFPPNPFPLDSLPPYFITVF